MSTVFFIRDGDRFFGTFSSAKTAGRFARKLGPSATILEIHGRTNDCHVESKRFIREGVPRGIVLASVLSEDIAAVREIAGKRGAEVRRLLAEATNFHFSIWATCADDPDDARLLAMH